MRVKATLSELHKRPGEVMRAVKSGHPVVLTEHGSQVAVISPLPTTKADRKKIADAMRNTDKEALYELGRSLSNGNSHH
jgi:prevent-host-death family protein